MSGHVASNDEDVFATNRGTDNSDALAPLSAKCSGDTFKTQLKLAKWDTPRTRAHNHATHTLSTDSQRTVRRIKKSSHRATTQNML